MKQKFESIISKMGLKKVINVPASVRDKWPTGTKVTVSPQGVGKKCLKK